MTTPDEHLAVLLKHAALCEQITAKMIDPSESRLGQNLKARAEAIRWLIAETAHGFDEHEVVT